MKYTKAIHVAPPTSFSVYREQSPANKILSQYLHTLIDYPEYLLASYQLVPTREQRILIDEIKFEKYGMVAWLAHFWFNRGRTIPDDLKNTALLTYKINAQLSDALLKLSEETFELSELLREFDLGEIDKDDKPGWLWLMCEIGKLCIRIEDSRLGLDLGIPDLSNPIPIVGKVEALDGIKCFIDNLDGITPTESISLNEFNIDNIDRYSSPLILLLSEAKRIAEINDEFATEHWEPYLKLMRQWRNKSRKDPCTQITYVRDDGSKHVTGKHRKLLKGFVRL